MGSTPTARRCSARRLAQPPHVGGTGRGDAVTGTHPWGTTGLRLLCQGGDAAPELGELGGGGRMRPSPTPRGAGARARRAGSWAQRQAEAMGAVPGVAWGSRAGPGSGTRPVQTGRASQTSSDRQRAPAKSTPRRGQAAGMRMLGQPGGGPWVGTAQQHRGDSFWLAWGALGGPQGAWSVHPSPWRDPSRKQGGEGSTQAAPGTGDKAPCRTSSEPGRAGCGPCGQLGHCHIARRSPCHPASPRGCGTAVVGLAGADGGVPGVSCRPPSRRHGQPGTVVRAEPGGAAENRPAVRPRAGAGAGALDDGAVRR